MLASPNGDAFDDPEWIFEIKWDGYRAIAEIGQGVKVYSRNGLSFSETFPPVAASLQRFSHKAVLDGEIVVLDEQGRPSFQLLQQYRDNPSLPILYYVFDLLMLDGKDLKDLPILQRKELLKHLMESMPRGVVRYCDHIREHGNAFFRQVVEMGLEGVVAKQIGSSYISGFRSKQWLKIKNNNSSEAVIVGYTEPKGSRKHFGALILAEYSEQGLSYIGHTGTGFDDKLLADLIGLMQPLKTGNSPFAEKIKLNGKVTWIKPELVCEVKFTEKTRDGLLRHPVFLGLRIDKSAREVIKTNEPMSSKAKSSLPSKGFGTAGYQDDRRS